MKAIMKLEDMFGLPKGTVLNAGEGKTVAVFSAPEQSDSRYEWNIVERKKPNQIAVNEILGEHITIIGDGRVRLNVPWHHTPHYEKNGGPLHKCYDEYSRFLTKAGIPEGAVA